MGVPPISSVVLGGGIVRWWACCRCEWSAGGYDGDITSNGEMNQFPDIFYAIVLHCVCVLCCIDIVKMAVEDASELGEP